MISYAPAKAAPAAPLLAPRYACKIPAPYECTPLYLDAARLNECDHIVDVALKLLVLHGKVKDREQVYQLPLTVLKGLMVEQLVMATGMSPYESHDPFAPHLQLLERDHLLPFANVHDGQVICDAGGLWLHARRRGYEGRPI